MIPVNRPVVTPDDELAVLRALRETLISGETPIVHELESELAKAVDVQHAVAVSSGTSACDLVTQAIGVGPGSLVVAPATTIISTVSQAARLGARIHVVDVTDDTWCIDPSHVANVLTRDTAAIYAVHLYGLVADMESLHDLAEQAGTLLIEDAAEALGQTFQEKPVGSLGDVSIFSFYANKVVTAGEGGAVLTDDSDIASEIRKLRNLYFDPHERFVHQDLGYNHRLGGLAASLAASQLRRLPDLLARKREVGHRYLANLDGHPWLRLPPAATSQTENSFWVFPVLLEDSATLDLEWLRATLAERGIDTRRFFYPLNRQPALLKHGNVIHHPTPIADRLWERGLYLPSGLGNTDNEIDHVSEVLWGLTHAR